MLLFVAVLVSCKDDDETAVEPVNEANQYVNNWILENMEYYYLWNESLPDGGDKNLDPDEYFASLLNADDRFSWIQEDYQELLNSLQGINEEAGYEYVLYRESAGSESVVAQLLYVKPGSPAASAGLRRGDLISRINNQAMTTANYRTLLAALKADHSLTYKQLDYETQQFGAEKTAQLSTVQYVENPNYLHKVFDVGGKKIGYYVYNFFAPGDGNAYDAEMQNIFADFKAQGVTDLVLDLRFNSGGSEVSAKKLASLIGTGVSNTKVFFKREYNARVKSDILADPSLGSSFLVNYFSNEGNNIGTQLSGNRVYILTSSRTASASELIINSLNPYMDVFLIGDVTYGKNVGSISIYEENDPKNKWGLQPIIVKVSNSEGFSDYGDGFTPDIVNEDNSIQVYPLGDTREELLGEAMAVITGSAPGRSAVRAAGATRERVGHSLDFKRRSFSLVLENELPR